MPPAVTRAGQRRTAGGRAVTSGPLASVPASQRELDPLLLLPVRLFVACLLADMRWCEDVTVRGVLRLSERRFVPHIEQLRAAGYLETRSEGRQTRLRLTPLGLDRLTEHVTALQTVARTAAELVAAQRDALRPSDSP
jgi:hypothetical protein